MTRADIMAMFRGNNPRITKNVVSDTKLYNWILLADKEVSAEARLIISDFTITSLVSTSVYLTRYDLSAEEPKFYDIDDYPGGGVSFDNEPLELTSPSELDESDENWRTRSAGSPDKYYRRGKYLYFDRPISSTYVGKEIRVYATLISDDFDNDTKSPFNGLAYLEPFHGAILKYLEWKAAEQIGDEIEVAKERAELAGYIKWMIKMVSGNKFSPIQFRPVKNRYSPVS